LVDVYKYKRKTTFKDYVTYAVALGLLGAAGLGAAYYLTRTEAERAALQEQALGVRRVLPGGSGEDEVGERETEGGAADSSSRASRPAAQSAGSSSSGATSAYAGGQKGVFYSRVAQAPQPTPEVLAYAQGLKISGVLPGPPAKARLNGQLWRAGDTIEPSLGIVWAGVDTTQQRLILKAPNDAELRVAY
jgi:hypothetical protein